MNARVGRFDYVVPEATRDYYRFVMVTLAEVPAGMYGMDRRRAELHAAMCAAYGLTPGATKTVTDNMDRIEHGAEGLHWALQDLRESLRAHAARFRAPKNKPAIASRAVPAYSSQPPRVPFSFSYLPPVRTLFTHFPRLHA